MKMWHLLFENLLCIYVDQRKPGQILRENQGKIKGKTKGKTKGKKDFSWYTNIHKENQGEKPKKKHQDFPW